MNIGFIGTGDISEAVITGMMRANYPVEKIAVSARSRHISSRLAEMYDAIEVHEDNQSIIDRVDLVFLAVLPQQAETVLTPLDFAERHEVVSLIGTVPVERIRAWSGASGPVTRAVPLPPVADLRGVTVLSGKSKRLEDLFDRLGGVIVAQSSSEFDALTVPSSLMGTFFGIQEIVAEWMQKKGVEEPDARRFISGLFLALARSGAESNRTFPDLREAHSTPGGLNEQAFRVFNDRGGAEALNGAMDSVLDRIAAGRGDG